MARRDDEIVEADYYDRALPVLTKGWWWKLIVLITVLLIPALLLARENGHWPFAG